MKKLSIFLFCAFILQFISAKDYTVSGYITDSKSGETLINASIYDDSSGKGTVSNLYGFYSLTLPEGEKNIRFHYVGYTVEFKEFTLTKDTVISIQLDTSNELKEVSVIGGYNKELGVKGTLMSAIEVPIAQIKAIPTLFGETDILKALQLLPGVQGGTEGSAGLYVRGGGPDQNLLLLDGVPVYNVNHMFGFFSVFNADAIKNVTLYKGNFPARFGGRLSSVLDIRMNDGNMQEYHGNISVGIISSKINVEGPIIKGKTSFNISGRRTYYDLLTQPIIKYAAKKEGMDGTTAGYYFYDLNAKINHKFSDKDRLYLSAYMGDDAIYASFKTGSGSDEDREEPNTYLEKMKMNWDWGNLITSLRWNRIVNQKLFMNTTAAYTRYRFNLKMNTSHKSDPPSSDDFSFTLGYHSSIEDYSAKVDFDFMPTPNHDIKFGAGYTYHSFRPGVMSLKAVASADIPENLKIGDEPIFSHETMLYAEDNATITDFLKANIGLNYSTFFVENRFYHSLQPRVSTRMLLNDRLSFKAAYAYMTQYIHLLSNNNISMPTDLWVPVTKRITPMNSHQFSAGFFYNLKDIVDLSVEGYYKTMNNLIEYKDGASFWGSTTGWEDKVSMGRGWSYGAEFLAQRSFGNTTGWLGYTWSKSERLFDRPGDELNFGEVFPAKYDRRHDFSLVVTHKFNKRIDISGTWVYSTGNAGTLAMQNYQGAGIPGANSSSSNTLPYIPSRNNYRYPDYHRMDIGVNFHKFKKRGMRTWSFSVYNLYNQMNPFMIFPYSESYYNPNAGMVSEDKKSLKKITIFPILPSISYSYKF